jgi:chaperonin GroEL (HSP60 family)
MIYNLKKTYPYAKVANAKLVEMNEHIKTLHSKREIDAYIKETEKEVRAEFEKQLVKLTVSQGKMLIKLIDRETGRTSYELVKELKGGFSAGFGKG